MEHELGNTAAVVVIVGNVAAAGGHDGPVAVISAGNIGGDPHLVVLGEADGTSVAYIGSKVQAILVQVAPQLLGLGSGLTSHLDILLNSRA